MKMWICLWLLGSVEFLLGFFCGATAKRNETIEREGRKELENFEADPVVDCGLCTGRNFDEVA